MGARVPYGFGDRFALAGFIVNGWNNVVENNGGKTFGVQASIKPTGKPFSSRWGGRGRINTDVPA
jgi:hypothetical protein